MAELSGMYDRRKVAGFTAFLRPYGYFVSVSETAMAVSCAPDHASLGTVMSLWRSIYAKDPRQWDLFPVLFAAYFDESGPRYHETEALAGDPLLGSPMFGASSVSPVATRVPIAYSPDAGAAVPLTPDPELDYGAVKPWSQRLLRLWADPHGHRSRLNGGTLDWRRVTQGALAHGGEVIDWPRVSPRPDRARIFVLLDASGSMRASMPFFLGLVWQWIRLGARVDVTLASNRICDVTRELGKTRPGGPPLMETGDLGGGTQLGQAFRWMYDRRPHQIRQDATLVIVSDGFDTGGIDIIGEYFPRLARRAGSVIWINPLLTDPGYQARSQALRVALPYCREHIGISDAASWIQYVRTRLTK